MNTTTLRTLTATLPNGETITRTTKAAYKFVTVALNPYSNEYEIQGWSTKSGGATTAHMYDRSIVDQDARIATYRKVQTVTIAVNA